MINEITLYLNDHCMWCGKVLTDRLIVLNQPMTDKLIRIPKVFKLIKEIIIQKSNDP